MDRLTYVELVRVGWMLFWRTISGFLLVTYGATSLLFVAMPDITRSAPSFWITLIPLVAGTVLSVFAFMPMIVRQTLRKPFRGFRFQVIRH